MPGHPPSFGQILSVRLAAGTGKPTCRGTGSTLTDEQALTIETNAIRRRLEPGDRPGARLDPLIIEAAAETLATALSSLGLVLEEAQHEAAKEDKDAAATEDKEKQKTPPSDEIVLVDLAILPSSGLLERTPTDIQLRSRFGINLLAVSSQGRRSHARLRTYRFKAGDVLLMWGTPEAIAEFASVASCVPLAGRALYVPDRRKAITASLIMGLAVAVVAFGLLPAAVACGGCLYGRRACLDGAAYSATA